MTSYNNVLTVIETAQEVGFTGIGLYPDWKPHVGFHLDTRPTARMGEPATWAQVKGQYVSLEAGLEALRNEERKQART